MVRLTRLIRRRQRLLPPFPRGRWGEVYRSIAGYQQRGRKRRKRQVRFWKQDADGPLFSVADDGEGIAPEHLPRLTERFYRVDQGRSRAVGGTGLGLAIVKHVLNRHDAHLLIASTLGAGSRFACQFPATRVMVRKPTVPVQRSEQAPT